MRVSTVSVILLLIGTANGADAPELKEGLWSIHRQTIDNPGNKKIEGTQTICRSHAFDQHSQELAKNVKGCTTVSDSFQGGKRVTELRCTIGGTVLDTKGTVVYQGDSSVHGEDHTTYTPAMNGVSESTMIQDQKYVGSCPAGVQPGDIINADGRVMHTWKH
jgi:ribosomal protein L27